MKKIFAVFMASSTLAATTCAITAHAANCLEYLSVEAAFAKEMESIWQAEEAVEATYNKEHSDSERQHGNAWRAATNAFQRVKDHAERAYKQASKAAWNDFEKAERTARALHHKAHSEAFRTGDKVAYKAAVDRKIKHARRLKRNGRARLPLQKPLTTKL